MDFRQRCCLHVSVPDGSRDQPDRFIFHIAFESAWRAAERDGEYRVSTRGKRLEDVGFIHAGFEHQVLDVGAAFYRDTYRRTDAGWKISGTGYDRTYDATMSLAGMDFKIKPGRALA